MKTHQEILEVLNKISTPSFEDGYIQISRKHLNELFTAILQDRDREMREMIEGMKKNATGSAYKKEYNNALDDLLSQLPKENETN